MVEKVVEPSPIFSTGSCRDLLESRERVNHECFLRGVREWIGEIFEIFRRDLRVTIQARVRSAKRDFFSFACRS